MYLVRRWAYAIFDTLCGKYGCVMTKNHLPPETTIAGTAKVLKNGFDDEPVSSFPENSVRREKPAKSGDVVSEGFGSDTNLRRRREEELRARQARGTPLSEAVKIKPTPAEPSTVKKTCHDYDVNQKMNSLTVKPAEEQVNYWYKPKPINPNPDFSSLSYTRNKAKDILELPEAEPVKKTTNAYGFKPKPVFNMNEEDFPSLR